MTAVHEAKSDHPPAKATNRKPTFNIYPLLGVLLIIAAAAVVYGGLLLLLIEEWTFFQPAGQGAARR